MWERLANKTPRAVSFTSRAIGEAVTVAVAMSLLHSALTHTWCVAGTLGTAVCLSSCALPPEL